jgi:integrase
VVRSHQPATVRQRPAKTLGRMSRDDFTTHGFRSTFRDWCAENTVSRHDAGEMALAHAMKDQTEPAYGRGDLYEKHRRLVSDWARPGASLGKHCRASRMR